jgi:hypothetical protein
LATANYSHWLSESRVVHVSRTCITDLANITIMQRLGERAKFFKSVFCHWNLNEGREAEYSTSIQQLFSK